MRDVATAVLAHVDLRAGSAPVGVLEFSGTAEWARKLRAERVEDHAANAFSTLSRLVFPFLRVIRLSEFLPPKRFPQRSVSDGPRAASAGTGPPARPV